MGIRSGFRAALEKNYPDAFVLRDLESYKSKKIAIDIMTMIFKYKSFTDHWLEGVETQLNRILHSKIYPIVVFEGKMPEEKRNECHTRQNKRLELEKKKDRLRMELDGSKTTGELSEFLIDTFNSLNKPKRPTNAAYTLIIEGLSVEEYQHDEDVWYKMARLEEYTNSIENQCRMLTSSDIDQVRLLCTSLNIYHFTADGEAEHACAWLCRNGIVDAVISDDSDLIALLCPIFLSKFKNGQVIEFSLSKLLSCSLMTGQQLVDWAIMCGTDYNPNIPRIGVIKAQKMILDYKDIDNIPLDTNILNHHIVRKIFSLSSLDNSDTMIKVSIDIKNVDMVRIGDRV